MEDLIINPGDFTPKINFSAKAGKLELTGTSIPEDAYNFYKPVVEWMHAYLDRAAPLTEMVFRMDYFNTSTTVFLLRLIKAAAQLHQTDKDVSIKWFYPEKDEDMLEAGRDFGVLAKIPVVLIPY